MAELVVTTFLSLDGVMQAPGGPNEDTSGGFEHGGWLVPYADEDLGELITGMFDRVGGFLLGRRTYEIFAAHWPNFPDQDDPVASRLNTLPKYVVSTTLDDAEWTNSTLIKENVVEQIAELRRRPGKEIQVHGSGELAQTLMKHDLVDEYRLWFYPVVLGSGRRLFRESGLPTAMKLIDSKTTGAGVTANTYRTVGRPTYGSFELER